MTYTPLYELPSSEVLTQHLAGNEPDTITAAEMMHAKLELFQKHRVLWDVVLPSGADDRNRLVLNTGRFDMIRNLGAYSLIHVVDTSHLSEQAHALGDKNVSGSVKIGLDVAHLTEWTRSRYMHSLPSTAYTSTLASEDIFWADELEGALAYELQLAACQLPSVRQAAVRALARLPGLVRAKAGEQ